MYIHPGLKSKLFANLTEIKRAFTNADNNFNPDQRELQAILHRMATTSNPRLAGIINTRRTALLSYDYTIENDEDNSIKNNLNNAIRSILYNCCNTYLYGVIALGIEWQLIDNVWKPFISKYYLPFELLKDFNNNVYYVETYDNGQMNKTLLEMNQNYIIATDGLNISGGQLRSLVYHEFIRQETLKEWLQFNQKLKGLIQAKAENDEKVDAANALNNFITNNYAVTSKEVEFVLNSLTDSKSLESFPRMLELINKEVEITILGQSNTTELPNSGGSRAALHVLNLVRADIIYSDMNLATDIINNQLLKYYYQLNQSPNATNIPYSFNFIYDENEDIEANSRMFENISRIGIEVKKDELYNKLGLSIPTDQDEVIKLEQPASRGMI